MNKLVVITKAKEGIYAILLLFACSIFLIHYAISGQAVYGDGIDYWVYLPSVYLDQDLDFANQYKFLIKPGNNNSFNPVYSGELLKSIYSETGRVFNFHPPGAALFWLPAFALADGLTVIFNLPRTGFANTYQILSGLWSIMIVIVGLVVCERLISKFIKDKTIASLSIIATFLTTPLLYYGAYDVLNSHFVTFTLAALFWFVILTKPANLKNSIIIGILIGLSGLVRYQELLLIIPAVIYVLANSEKPIQHTLILASLAFIVFSPALFLWQYFHGKPLPVFYMTHGLDSRWNFGSLWHKTNGLFSRTPILLMALIIGGKRYWEKHRSKSRILFLTLFVQYILITFQGGWNAAAYGGRMYISILPIFCVFVGEMLVYIRRYTSIRIAKIIVTLFAVLNCISIGSFILFEKEVNSGNKRGLEPHTIQKLERMVGYK